MSIPVIFDTDLGSDIDVSVVCSAQMNSF